MCKLGHLLQIGCELNGHQGLIIKETCRTKCVRGTYFKLKAMGFSTAICDEDDYGPLEYIGSVNIQNVTDI